MNRKIYQEFINFKRKIRLEAKKHLKNKKLVDNNYLLVDFFLLFCLTEDTKESYIAFRSFCIKLAFDIMAFEGIFYSNLVKDIIINILKDKKVKKAFLSFLIK